MAKSTRTRTKEPTRPHQGREAEEVKPSPRTPPEPSSSTGRDEKLIGAERFPRKGDDEESS
jgi:hypothetical protein